MNTKPYSLFSSYTTIISLVVLFLLTIWWILLRPFSPTPENESIRNIWGGIYQVMAYLGGISGLLIAKKWGGRKSILGKSILAFSIGLLCQGFGQSVYTFYLFDLHIAAPYPSLGDIGYFGTIPFYIYGVILLAKVNNISVSLKSYIKKIQALLLPLAMLLISYFFFLKGYEFDWSNKLKIFLDFGYPFGQTIYVSIALLIFIFSRKILGGILRFPILFLLIALIAQYVSDFIFLYQNNAGSWYVAGVNDYLYLISYFLMTIAIVYIGNMFQQIRSENAVASSPHPEINTPNDKLFNQILVEIIKRQERIAGHLAWEQVRRIENIIVNDETIVNVSINGDPKKAIDQLVYSYKNLFGDIAVDVSKSAVRYLTAELPSDQVPDSLK